MIRGDLKENPGDFRGESDGRGRVVSQLSARPLNQPARIAVVIRQLRLIIGRAIHVDARLRKLTN